MDRRHVAILAFALSVALGLCHALSYSTLLPDTVACQFDAHGFPTDSMSRSTMIDVQLTVITAIAALFAAAAAAVVTSPRRWFGVPNRQWWLTGPREESTRRDLLARVLLLGCATELFVFCLFHRTVRVNLGRAESLETWFVDIAVFMGIVAVWLVLYLVRYRRVPSASR